MKKSINDNILGTLLSRKRKLKKFTQQEIGKMIGKKKSYISKIESGEWNLPRLLLLILIEQLWDSNDHFELDKKCLIGRNSEKKQ